MLQPAAVSPEVAERRSSPRFKLEAQITATSQANFWCGFSEDLSEGGIFVSMSIVPDVGELVHLAVRVGAEPPVTAIGQVQWHRLDDDGKPCGCGVQFVMLDPRATDLLQGMLARSAQAPLLVDDFG
ncbi:hypothetical protein LBMAG42_30350 [Deltaproteobacteria bacterium]|nr:hypothetical protein LBMAG42_30350 [Deltaproteobacteria bacterium]